MNLAKAWQPTKFDLKIWISKDGNPMKIQVINWGLEHDIPTFHFCQNLLKETQQIAEMVEVLRVLKGFSLEFLFKDKWKLMSIPTGFRSKKVHNTLKVRKKFFAFALRFCLAHEKYA